MNKISGNHLSALLPYDTEAKKNLELKKGLKEYRALLTVVLEANQALQAGNLEKFDSLVGENACQIRAIRIAIIASKKIVDFTVINGQIKQSLEKVDLLLEPKLIESLMTKSVSLKSLLKEKGLDIFLTEEQDFVVQAYLLKEIKIIPIDKPLNSIYQIEGSNVAKICRFGDITKSFANSLVAKTKKTLAAASVQFMKNSAAQLQDPLLERAASKEFTVAKNGLSCIPMFWTYKTILLTAQKEGVPLLVHVKFLEKEGEEYTVIDEEHMLFQTSENKRFIEVDSVKADRNQPALIVQGVACGQKGQGLTKDQWKESMRKTTPVGVILAGAADHRQYPDSTQDALVEKLADQEYEGYKALAQSHGFSDKNPATFFIQHVYATRIDLLLEAISQGKNGRLEKGDISLIVREKEVG
jgi:hypothetical protein